jgi:hypothetical protein
MSAVAMFYCTSLAHMADVKAELCVTQQRGAKALRHRHLCSRCATICEDRGAAVTSLSDCPLGNTKRHA